MSQHQVAESSSVIIHGFQIKLKGPVSLPAAPPPWRFSYHHAFTTPPPILREPLSPLLHHRTQFIWAPHYRRRRPIEPMLDASSAQITDPTATQDAPFRQQPSLLPLSLKSCTISAVLSEPRHLHPSSATVDFRRTSSLQAVAG
ncbi:hypothetical protein M0R45_010527 [Rubus argutus]|uniref:Uncharacterized protein n=1 Tax=Rubus argutus TaxID=59490 RepID=A0AAW1Y7J0_RUBAR